MALPSGYKRLAYIRSNGTQYIDTGFKPNQDTRVVAKVRCVVGTAANYIFGARYALSQKNYSFFASKNGHYAFIYNTKQVDFDESANTDEPFVIDFNKNVATIGNNSVSGTYATFTAPVNLILFGVNSPDKIIYGSSDFDTCEVYDNGTLVRDYIACETEDGEPGMWDDLNGEFYGNAGTGSFIAGPEIGADGFPVSYRRLPFIQSTGTQYLDTGYFPKWNTRIVDEIKMSAYSSTKAAFGTRNSNSATASKAYAVFQTGANTFRADYFGSSKTITLDVSTDQKLTIDMNKNVCAIGGKTATNTAVTSGAAGYSLLLFTYSNSGSAGGLSSMCRYSTKIYENDILVHDYVPCETDAGDVGMWDTVDLCFLGNAGTGSFINPLDPHDGHNTNIGGVAREIEYGTVLIGGVSREFKKGTVRVGGVLRDLVLKTEIFTITTTGKLGGYCKVTADGTSLTAGKTYEVEEDTQITVVVTSDYTANTLPGKIYLNGTLLDSRNYTFPVTSNVTIEGLENYTTAAGGGYWGRANITTK